MTELLPDIYAVEVPIEATTFLIKGFDEPKSTKVYYIKTGVNQARQYALISTDDNLASSLTILGTVTPDKIDFDVSGLVESAENKSGSKEYKNYHTGQFYFFNGPLSFMSLLSSKQLDPNKKYVIIRKK